jgi:type I restriction enzyme M protein
MPKPTKKADTTANLGFEAKLWAAADALRNNMDAAEHKHVVLVLIFLKYISDAFEAKHAELGTQQAEGADPEDRDEYRAASMRTLRNYGNPLDKQEKATQLVFEQAEVLSAERAT